MSKKYVLVIEETDFYDPHGTPDSGGTYKFVSDEDEYTSLEEGKIYNDDFEEFDEEEDHYGEDGYNCEITTFSIKFIDESDYRKYKAIIKAYDELSIGEYVEDDEDDDNETED